MKNVMWKGELQGILDLDTISNKTHLYGLGPVEYLAGEVMIVDGKSCKSAVISKDSMRVEETFDIKAPFFAYANIPSWSEHALPDTVLTIPQLEAWLDGRTKNLQRPFLFRLEGTVERAQIHVVNLPEGSKVSSPQDAHKGQVNYQLSNEEVEIIGFFSTEHKAIFTHHDTYLHMHLMTADKKMMGHLDEVVLRKGSVRVFLPGE